MVGLYQTVGNPFKVRARNTSVGTQTCDRELSYEVRFHAIVSIVRGIQVLDHTIVSDVQGLGRQPHTIESIVEGG